MITFSDNLSGRKIDIWHPDWWYTVIYLGPISVGINIHPNRFRQIWSEILKKGANG